eukprot:scaffold170448_cov23-Tisochrysis_lutea.AAC.6
MPRRPDPAIRDPNRAHGSAPGPHPGNQRKRKEGRGEGEGEEEEAVRREIKGNGGGRVIKYQATSRCVAQKLQLFMCTDYEVSSLLSGARVRSPSFVMTLSSLPPFPFVLCVLWRG